MSTALETKKPFWQKRFTVLTMVFIAFVICYLDRVNISIAAISMQKELGWTNVQKGWVFSAFFWGYFPLQIVGGYLSNRFGAKLVLGFAVLFWSFFTVITPWAAVISIPALLAARFLMGLGEAGLSPSSFTVAGRWFPHHEQTRVMGFFSSGTILGTVLALIGGSWLITHYGWESVFYVFGALGVIWSALWYFVFHNQPEDHPTISPEEINLIQSGGGVKEKSKTIPWSQILFSPRVWAICVVAFAASWTLYIFLSWLPSYFADVHGLNLSGAGIYALLPWITMFIMLNFSAWVADKMLTNKVSTTKTRKLMVAIGFLGSALMMVILRGAGSPEMATLLMCAALGIISFAYAGLVPNSLDIAPKYADIVYGVANTIGVLAGAIGAPAAGYIVQNTGSYDNVFLVSAIISVIGCIIYLLLGTGEKVID